MRGRRLSALLAAGLLALAVTGCGGGEPLAPQVPGEPAEVRIPEAAEPPGGADPESTADPATGEEDTGTTDEGATTDGTTDGTTAAPETTTPPVDETGEAPVPDDGGGATAPEAVPDGPANDTPPPAGSDAEQFEDFCAQNPGAC